MHRTGSRVAGLAAVPIQERVLAAVAGFVQDDLRAFARLHADADGGHEVGCRLARSRRDGTDDHHRDLLVVAQLKESQRASDGGQRVVGTKAQGVDDDEGEVGPLDGLQPAKNGPWTVLEDDESPDVAETGKPQRELDDGAWLDF